MSKTDKGSTGYLPKVLALLADLPKGGVHRVEVLHEARCRLLAGHGPCNCRPDVRLVRGTDG